MNVHDRINHQRLQYIIDSYDLDRPDPSAFQVYLNDLMATYPAPLIELAIAETLTANWLQIPMVRGVEFLNQVHAQLTTWAGAQIVSRLTPASFQQITGLDAAPILAMPEVSLPKFPAPSP